VYNLRILMRYAGSELRDQSLPETIWLDVLINSPAILITVTK
jgi:hypothetical protein